MKLFDELEDIAAQELLRYCGDSARVTYKKLSMTSIDKQSKPLLLLGHWDSVAKHGYCTAILNPDVELVTDLYPRAEFASKLRGRCDAAVNVFVDEYSDSRRHGRRTLLGSRYQAERLKPAKFKVNSFGQPAHTPSAEIR